ncbi:MAG: MBL fold metallo-hydrolase [Clostridia bacterium]
MAGSKNLVYVDIMAMHPEVTGSCMLCIVKSKNKEEEAKFIVDCGLFQEQEYNELNKELPFNAEEIDFAILTHNHVDHTGRIPYLVKKGFSNHFLTTSITERLVELALKDSCKVLRDVAKRNNVSPLYTEEDVENALSLVYGFEFETEIQVKPNIKVTFFKN